MPRQCATQEPRLDRDLSSGGYCIMSQELIYTSVPRGLKPGSKGFCTVAQTAGLSIQWAERLESLSGYRPVFPLGDPSASKNPVNWAHWRVNVGGQTRSVLSRVAFAGVDYSQRSNKFAHHLVLEPNEQAAGGPAWLMLQSGVMERQWARESGILPQGRTIPQGERARRPCAAWAAATGDAGWGGVLAEAFATEPTKPAYLIFAPGADVLPLIDEALGLLPPDKRWQVTFSTYFTEVPAGLNCAWRAVAAGTVGGKEALRSSGRATVIDLTRSLGEAVASFATAARTGQESAEIGRKSAARTPPATKDYYQAAGVVRYDRGESASEGLVRSTRRLADGSKLELVEDPVGNRDFQVPRESNVVTVVETRGIAVWAMVLIGFGCFAIGITAGLLFAPFSHNDLGNRSTNSGTNFQKQQGESTTVPVMQPGPGKTLPNNSVPSPTTGLVETNGGLNAHAPTPDTQTSAPPKSPATKPGDTRNNLENQPNQPSNQSGDKPPAIPQWRPQTTFISHSASPGTEITVLALEPMTAGDEQRWHLPSKLSGSSRLSIRFPNGLGVFDSARDNFVAVVRSDGLAVGLIRNQTTRFVQSPAPDAFIEIQGDYLVCRLPPRSETIVRWLNRSVVRVTSSEKVFDIALERGETLKETSLNRTEYQLAAFSDLAEIPEQLELRVVGLPGWTSTQAADLKPNCIASLQVISARASTANFTFSLGKGAKSIGCDWKDERDSALKHARKLKIVADSINTPEETRPRRGFRQRLPRLGAGLRQAFRG